MVTGDSRKRHPRCTDPEGRREGGWGWQREGRVKTPAKGEENRQAWKMMSHVTSCGTVGDPMSNKKKQKKNHAGTESPRQPLGSLIAVKHPPQAFPQLPRCVKLLLFFCTMRHTHTHTHCPYIATAGRCIATDKIIYCTEIVFCCKKQQQIRTR